MPFDRRLKELARAHDAVDRLREIRKAQEDQQRHFETKLELIVRTIGAIAMMWLVYWSWLQMTALP